MTKASLLLPETYGDFLSKVQKSWGADTSSSSEWSSELPESGQCAVVALLFQELFGGKLLRAEVNEVSHYWNEVDGITVDLTRSQFEEPLTYGTVVERERSYVLSFPATVERYNLLKTRFEQKDFAHE